MNQPTTTPPTPDQHPGSDRRSRHLLRVGGTLGLGVAGMLLLGIVVINDQDDPIDEPSPDLADDVLSEGLDVDLDPFDPGPDPFDDVVIGGADDTNDPFGDPVDDDDDILIGGADGDDVLIGGDPLDDDVLIGSDDDLLDPFGPPSGDVLIEPTQTGLKSLCADAGHRTPPGMEGRAKSGIWIDGTIYGFPEGSWIWIQGGTLDNGEGQKIPVIDGRFDAPLGINDFGNHRIEHFQLMHADPSIPPVDLLPAAEDAFDATFTVGPEEGPLLEGGCLEFDPIVTTSHETQAEAEFNEELAAGAGADELATATGFMESWVDAHRRGDAERLFDTLDPIAPQSFGEDTCREYVATTAGSIADAEVRSADRIGPWEFGTPSGPVVLPQVIGVDLELTTSGGDVITAEANLPVAEDGTVGWLTTCGVDLP